MGAGGGAPRAPAGAVMARGLLVAAIITAPSLAAFAGLWALLGDALTAAAAGAAVHFAALGAVIKMSGRLFPPRSR